MELQVSKKYNFFSLVMALVISLGMFVVAGTNVYASEESHTTVSDIEDAVGNSVFFNEQTRTFFVDTDLAIKNGLNEQHIVNLNEWTEFINSDERFVNDSLEYAGELPDIQTRILPAVVVAALKAIGGGALAAVGAAIALHGMKGACKRVGLKYKPFGSFCKSNGFPSGACYGNGCGREF